jgi:hypothetical protein
MSRNSVILIFNRVCEFSLKLSFLTLRMSFQSAVAEPLTSLTRHKRHNIGVLSIDRASA